MQALPYTLTNDSITIVWNGQPYTVRQGAANFNGLVDAVLKARQSGDWTGIENFLTVGKSLQEWAKGKFTVEGSTVLFDGKAIPNDVNDRIRSMAARGEDPSPLFLFWERLQSNPSWRSVQQLYPFLKHQGIPFTEDGHFLAYKGVNQDYTDRHSGRFENKPGAVHEIPRNMVSDDPSVACHVGFHVGARSYAADFGSRTVICKVDPKDVVCIPYDESQRKMRVCKYQVIGHDNGTHMPSTTMSNSIINTPHVLNPEVMNENDSGDGFIEIEECLKQGMHLKNVDPDGHCLSCGEQKDGERCKECGGEGRILIEAGDDYEGTDDEFADCEACDAKGWIFPEPDLEDEKVSMEPGDGEHEESEDSYSNYNERTELTADEQELIHDNEIIKAIKAIRGRKHCSLKEAKDIVDSFRRGGVPKKSEKPRKPVPKKYAKLQQMDAAKLMEQSIDKLRDYAGKGLSIVGASKIPGGKAALVAKIIEVRE